MLEIFNKDSFFYVAPSGDISSILTTANFNEVKRKEMVSADKLTNEGLFLFSWHPDIEAIFWERNQKSLGDEIRSILQTF